MSLDPVIDPAIWRLRPDFVALSLIVRKGRNAPSDNRSAAMLEAASRDAATAAGWTAAHLNSWRAAYRAFGAKPQRTPCSPKRCAGAPGMCQRSTDWSTPTTR